MSLNQLRITHSFKSKQSIITVASIAVVGSIILIRSFAAVDAPIVYDPNKPAIEQVKNFNPRVRNKAANYHSRHPKREDKRIKDAEQKKLVQDLKERKKAVVQAIKSNPDQLAQLTLSDGVKNELPEEALSQVETITEVTGNWLYGHGDPLPGKDSKASPFATIRQSDGTKVSMYGKLPDLKTGEEVKVKGIKLDFELAVSDSENSIQFKADHDTLKALSSIDQPTNNVSRNDNYISLASASNVTTGGPRELAYLSLKTIPADLDIANGGILYVLNKNKPYVEKRDNTGATLIKSWGSDGTANNAYKSPSAIAVDSAENVYILDAGNSRIQKTDKNGKFLKKWGSKGSGNGQFSFPSDLAIDSLGNVYVTDTGNSRIQKFDANGTFKGIIGSAGTGDGQFNNLSKIAVDSLNNIFVTDNLNNRVQKFDSAGIFLLKFGVNGTANSQFINPSAIATDKNGNVYIADKTRRVQIFNSTGTFISKWSDQVITDDATYINYLTISPGVNNLYLTYSSKAAIYKFESAVASTSQPTYLLCSQFPAGHPDNCSSISGIHQNDNLDDNPVHPATDANGGKKILIIPVGVIGDTTVLTNSETNQPLTMSDIKNAVADPNRPDSISSNFKTMSYGALNVQADILPDWVRIPANVLGSGGDLFDLRNIIEGQVYKQITSRQINISGYTNILYAYGNFPGTVNNKASGWSFTFDNNTSVTGLVGESTIVLDANQKRTVNLSEVIVSSMHELGHAFGLNHAHSIIGEEYGDNYSFMSDAYDTNSGEYSAFHKYLLGWVGKSPTKQIKDVTTTGTYTVSQLGGTADRNGIRALRIPVSYSKRSVGKVSDAIYLEYRPVNSSSIDTLTQVPSDPKKPEIKPGMLLHEVDVNKNSSDIGLFSHSTYLLNLAAGDRKQAISVNEAYQYSKQIVIGADGQEKKIDICIKSKSEVNGILTVDVRFDCSSSRLTGDQYASALTASKIYGNVDINSKPVTDGDDIVNGNSTCYNNASKYLFVADSNRVLVYDTSITSRKAVRVLGATEIKSTGTLPALKTSTYAHNAAPTDALNPGAFVSDKLSIACDSRNNRLFVMDTSLTGKGRILVFDLAPGISNGMAPKYVLGQRQLKVSSSGSFSAQFFDDSLPAKSDSTFSGVYGGNQMVYANSQNFLYLSDTSNSRIMVWDVNNGIVNYMPSVAKIMDGYQTMHLGFDDQSKILNVTFLGTGLGNKNLQTYVQTGLPNYGNSWGAYYQSYFYTPPVMLPFEPMYVSMATDDRVTSTISLWHFYDPRNPGGITGGRYPAKAFAVTPNEWPASSTLDPNNMRLYTISGAMNSVKGITLPDISPIPAVTKNKSYYPTLFNDVL